MSAPETRTSAVGRVLRRTRTIPGSPAFSWRSCLGHSLAAHAVGLLVVAQPSVAQITPPASPRTSTQVTESIRQVDAAATSCSELKSRVRDSDSGALVTASGPTGGSVFFARAPQCDFWQRSQFTYVMANDGWCGVGYTCTGKIQGGR